MVQSLKKRFAQVPLYFCYIHNYPPRIAGQALKVHFSIPVVKVLQKEMHDLPLS